MKKYLILITILSFEIFGMSGLTPAESEIEKKVLQLCTVKGEELGRRLDAFAATYTDPIAALNVTMILMKYPKHHSVVDIPAERKEFVATYMRTISQEEAEAFYQFVNRFEQLRQCYLRAVDKKIHSKMTDPELSQRFAFDNFFHFVSANANTAATKLINHICPENIPFLHGSVRYPDHPTRSPFNHTRDSFLLWLRFAISDLNLSNIDSGPLPTSQSYLHMILFTEHLEARIATKIRKELDQLSMLPNITRLPGLENLKDQIFETIATIAPRVADQAAPQIGKPLEEVKP